MEVTVLGAHHLGSTTSWLSCLLIDGVLALDAGSLSSGLSIDDQKKVRAVLITHRHFDHVADLPIFGLATAYDSTKEICSLDSTLAFVQSHLLDGDIYPKMDEFPAPDKPSFRLRALSILEEADVAGYKVKPIPVKHGSLAAVGYEVVSNEGRSLFYTGDTGGGLAGCWQHTTPDLLAIEVSLPDSMEERAENSGHLTPLLLEKELVDFKRLKGFLPHVLAMHMSPVQEDEIRAELAQLSRKLAVKITPGKRHLKLNL